MQYRLPLNIPDGYELIFRPWRRCPRTGTKIYAKQYGLRAWPIIVPIKR